ncbi:hypothetical protein K4F52_004990 [Lecanicillium sp. MT-2017a]|nr:hypothetical protein K4F52_004990 [Lecanicillium sp. MT-2017a]
MATQQVLYAETIAGMKKAFKRKAYESDSDSEIDHYSNRGHKLQKRGRFARKGQLVPPTGPSSYKEGVDYAGIRRSVIYRNPPLLDDEGYEIDSDDDEQRVADAVASAAELNPYANVRLEHVLAPLIASTDLATHPTLSKPFTSKTLTTLVDHSCRLMRKENQSLWEVRQLWTSLYGDGVWLPCELMIGDNDGELYTQDQVARHTEAQSKSATATVNGESSEPAKVAVDGETTDTAKDNDVSMVDADAAAAKDPSTEEPTTNGNGATEENTKGKEAETSSDAKKADAQSGAEQNGPQDGQDTSETEGSSFIHPIFMPPATAKPDRDLGLPGHEAEDIRRLLALYVQKQEEVCRGTYKLHRGLLKAQRLRGDVLHWSKAEAHCGPNRDLSDGEDWYDKEEWGLTEDLKKGQDEEEEEVTTQGKKTRNRRG